MRLSTAFKPTSLIIRSILFLLQWTLFFIICLCILGLPHWCCGFRFRYKLYGLLWSLPEFASGLKAFLIKNIFYYELPYRQSIVFTWNALELSRKGEYFHLGTLESLSKAFFSISRFSRTIANLFLKMRFYPLDLFHAWPCISMEMHYLYVLFAFFSILQAYGNWFQGLWLLHLHFCRWYDKLYCATFKFLIVISPCTSHERNASPSGWII